MSQIKSRQDLLSSFSGLSDKFKAALVNAQKYDSDFEKLRTNFHNQLLARVENAKANFPEGNPLSETIDQFTGLIEHTHAAWEKKINGKNKGVEFREKYTDSVLVFVYGKVKSGKSSLGNYMAWGYTDPKMDSIKTIAENSRPVFFTGEQNHGLDNGDKENEAGLNQSFRVGATEATSSIQDFRLPGLTWVDSPGLHSVNEVNGQLAKDYVEHADLILYITKSDSPGRDTDMQEIKDLLSKDKRVFVILTASDDIEEDVDENGELIKTVVMKSRERREKQAQYVQEAISRLGLANTNHISIISLSARYAMLHESNQELFQDSGMNELFDALYDASQQEGVALKQQVPLTNFKNFLSECMEDLIPYKELIRSFEPEITKVENSIPKLLSAELYSNEQNIRSYIEGKMANFSHYKDDEKAMNQHLNDIYSELNAYLNKLVKASLESIFSEVRKNLHTNVSLAYNTSQLAKTLEYKLETIEREIVTGVTKGTKQRNGAIGAFLGTAAGALLGPVGAAIGGALGAAAGSALGDSSNRQTKTINVSVGDNFLAIQRQLIAQAEKAVADSLSAQTNTILKAVIEDLQILVKDLNLELDNVRGSFKNLMRDIELELRPR